MVWLIYQAFACFSSCLRLDSKHVDSLMGMGSLYKSKGMLHECVEVVTKALEVVPSNQVYYAVLLLHSMCFSWSDDQSSNGNTTSKYLLSTPWFLEMLCNEDQS